MSITRIPSNSDRARVLLTDAVAEGGEPVSRTNLLNKRGGTGNINLGERRKWAEAWSLLQRAGFVCPEPEYPRAGDKWFVTGAGEQAHRTDFEGALQLALSHGL